MTKQAADTHREDALRVAGASRAWLVVSTNSHKEMLVMSQLNTYGFEGYRPMVLRERKVRGQEAPVLAPVSVFPNYLFVRSLTGMWRSLYGILGVAWVFPRAVLPSVIDELRAEEVSGAIPSQPTPETRYQCGDKITTLGGLLTVMVSEPIDTNRVAALSSFMNGAARLTVRTDRIIPGDSHKAIA